MSNTTLSEESPEKKIEKLEKENRKLKKKIEGLQKTMDITTGTAMLLLKSWRRRLKHLPKRLKSVFF